MENRYQSPLDAGDEVTIGIYLVVALKAAGILFVLDLLPSVYETAGIILTALLVVVAVANAVVAYGLLRLRAWGWLGYYALFGVQVVTGFLVGNPVPAGLELPIVVYLYTKMDLYLGPPEAEPASN